MPAVGQPRPGFDPYRIRLRRRAYRSTSALAGTHHWHCGRIVRIRDPFSGRRRNLHPHHSAPRRFGFRAGSPPCFRRPKPFNQNHPRHHTSSPGFRRSPPIQSFQNLRRQPDMQNQVHQYTTIHTRTRMVKRLGTFSKGTHASGINSAVMLPVVTPPLLSPAGPVNHPRRWGP